jgi:hypothetical protein
MSQINKEFKPNSAIEKISDFSPLFPSQLERRTNKFASEAKMGEAHKKAIA